MRPRRGGSDAPGEPRLDLLQEPAVAVGILERGQGRVRVGLGMRSRHRLAAEAAEVEGLADVDAVLAEIASRLLDVRDDEIEVLDRARRCCRDSLAEVDGALRAGRR